MNKFDINEFRQIHKHCHIRSTAKQTAKRIPTTFAIESVNSSNERSNENAVVLNVATQHNLELRYNETSQQQQK